MQLRGSAGHDLLSVEFNQDYSCLSVGTKHGYRLYNTDPFAKVFEEAEGGCSAAVMLFVSSLVALVGSGHSPAFSTRRLQLRNTKSRSNITELTFLTSVLGARLSRRRLLVVLEARLHVYDLNAVRLLDSPDTAPNPRGLCALSSADAPQYAVYPTSSTSGEVAVYDALAAQVVHRLVAHKGPISALAVSADGALLATASDKGTVVRVFSLPDGAKRHTLRRGTSAAAIRSLAFALDASLLAVASDHGTVHVFRLARPAPAPASAPAPPLDQDGFAAPGPVQAAASGAGAGAVASYLGLGAVWEQGERDFAWARLPAAQACVCGFSRDARQLLVATEEGAVCFFAIDPAGGECRLVRKASLLDASPHLRAVVYPPAPPPALPGPDSPAPAAPPPQP